MSDATVFVVDDDEEVRTSIKQLANSIGLDVFAFASAREFLDGVNENAPGCLVTDVRMPGMSGLELQQTMRQAEMYLPVIIMTGYAEVPMAVQAFHEGAFDFVQKPFSPQAMLEIIQRAIKQDEDDRQKRQQVAAFADRYERLSPRESQVMKLLVDGKTTKEIGRSLNISLTTVDFHRNNILDKCDAQNVVELTRSYAEFSVLSEGSSN